MHNLLGGGKVEKEFRQYDSVSEDQSGRSFLINPVSHPHKQIENKQAKRLFLLFALNLVALIYDWHGLSCQDIWGEFLVDCGASWNLGEWHGLRGEIFHPWETPPASLHYIVFWSVSIMFTYSFLCGTKDRFVLLYSTVWQENLKSCTAVPSVKSCYHYFNDINLDTYFC